MLPSKHHLHNKDWSCRANCEQPCPLLCCDFVQTRILSKLYIYHIWIRYPPSLPTFIYVMLSDRPSNADNTCPILVFSLNLSCRSMDTQMHSDNQLFLLPSSRSVWHIPNMPWSSLSEGLAKWLHFYRCCYSEIRTPIPIALSHDLPSPPYISFYPIHRRTWTALFLLPPCQQAGT